jgi:transcriptional regulator with XRE-family HTH domain
MIPTAEQRRVLGAFLRVCRERLTPAEAHINGGSARRRTPGLRREEVAQLCGMSPTWYTWLEQGREISLSPHALARIADALQLTSAERAYVFELTHKRDPSSAAEHAQGTLSGALVSALQAITAPAYVLDRNWQACGWNAAAQHLFAQWLEGRERNLLRYMFLDPSARDFICDWDNRGRRLVAEFRADTAARMDDEEVTVLVRELCQASPPFMAFWNDRSVLAREGGIREFNHPQDGYLRYAQLTLIPAAHAGYKLVMLMNGPTDGEIS